MTNTRVVILIGSGVATGLAVMYAARKRNARRHSLIARTSKQAAGLKHSASKLRHSAVELIDKGREKAELRKKGLTEAVEAGKAAYQRVVG